MKINDTIINADLGTILTELQRQLNEQGINLLSTIKNTDDNYMVTCPYHKDGQERRPSAGIRKSDGTFHCLACGETHSLPEVISYCFGWNDVFGKQGLRWILDNFNAIQFENRNIGLKIHRGETVEKETPNYVSEEELDKYRYTHPYWVYRGIVDDDIIELFDLGFDEDTQCVTFPVRDENGNCLFVARRSVHTKYFNYPAGADKPLYGLYEYMQVLNNAINIDIMRGRGSCKSALLNVTNKIYVTESMIDCILLWQSGRFAIALNGTGSKEQLEMLEKLPCRKLVLATDNDEAGYNARKKIRRYITNKIITEIEFPPNIKDIGECTYEEIANLKEIL